MIEYLDLVRQGPRSLKYELSRLVALVTIYGQQSVLDACAECLGSGVVGVDNLELHLKRTHHPSTTKLQVAPMTFNTEGERADLSASENERNNNEHSDNQRSDFAAGAIGIEAQILGAGNSRGLAKDAGSAEGIHLQIHDGMDTKGEVRAPHANDSEQDQECKISSSSNGGEF
jgi:hypothetical protein